MAHQKIGLTALPLNALEYNAILFLFHLVCFCRVFDDHFLSGLKKWKMFVIQLIWWISMISYQIATLLTDVTLNNSAALITLTIVENCLDATAKILTLFLFIFPFITQSIHILNAFSTMLMGCSVAIQLMVSGAASFV